jgi:cytochrome c oxidase subunit 1
MHIQGLAGHPRRYPDTRSFDFLQPIDPMHTFITAAAYMLAAGQVLFLFNFLWSLRQGKRAADNPWEATTLEWTVSSPPPHDNFGGEQKIVSRGAYEYSLPDAERDFVMQDDPSGAPASAG